MNILTNLFSNEHDNEEINLPQEYVKIHQDPHTMLGITQVSPVIDSRAKLREICLNLNLMFTGMKRSKLDFKQALLAFYLCQSVFPNRAHDILEKVNNSPLFLNWTPDDIIPCLKPLHIQGIEMNNGVRASKFLAIQYTQTETSGVTMTHTFKVNYCLRMYDIKKTYAEFQDLHLKLLKELLMVPAFPEPLGLKVIFGATKEEGIGLAAYLQRIHISLASRGMFSPRVFEFLGIDVARVHIEEEGRIIQYLDTPTLPPQSCWQIVDEQWLKKWRKFALGRGARRYVPPGKITNENLRTAVLVKGKHPIPIIVRAFKKDLQIVEHYRVVNYNVWVFWQRVHGYDITITRVGRDIYADRGIGYLQAIIKLQSFLRMILAAKKYSKDYLINFSRSAPGARELMFKHKVDTMKEQAKKSIEKAKEARRERRLKRAALFTQRLWREKKHIDFQEAPLIAMKHAQEVFASSEGRVEEATGAQPLVVYEGVPVISIGTAEEYEHFFLEENGLTIGLTEHVPSGLTYVSQTEDDIVITDSILLSINDYPVTTLSYSDIMERLKHSRWPLKLKFRRPLGRNEVYTLVRIHDEIQNSEIKIQALKRKLTRGVTLTKHGQKGRPHITRLFITDTHLFWETKTRLREGVEKIWKDSCKSITLYDIQFVRPGKETKQLQGLRKKKINPDLCFSIFTDIRTLDFQVSDENGEGKKRRDVLVWAFRQIIEEMRTSQLFVDKNGNPIRRHTQKKKLRSIHL